MTDMITFDFDGLPVRVQDETGEPWFVLADVCRVLEIGNPSQAATRLDDDEKMTLTNNEGRAGSGAQAFTIINESGLYSLILTSRKPAAKRFKKWVTAEVLPAIRRTGRFAMDGVADAFAPDGPLAPPVVDLPDVYKMTAGDRNSYTRMALAAKQLFGKAAGISVWRQSPLLQPSAGALPPPEDMVLDGEAAKVLDADGCLRHLLAGAPFPRNPHTVARLLFNATTYEHTRRRLAAAGVWLMPDGYPDFVAVAHQPTPRSPQSHLTGIFAGSHWHSDWGMALSLIDGARLASGQVMFPLPLGGQKAVLLPLDLVMDVAMEVQEAAPLMAG